MQALTLSIGQAGIPYRLDIGQLLHGQSQGLFDKDVLPGAQGSRNQLRMTVVACRHHHNVSRGIMQQSFDIGRSGGETRRFAVDHTTETAGIHQR